MPTAQIWDGAEWVEIQAAAAEHDHAATSVSFTPTGTIAATNVSAALAELDAEKSATGHTHASTLGTLGYAQVTASQGSITTEVDLTGLAVTVTVAAGRRIRISGYGLFQSTVTDDVCELRIKEGATLLNLWTGTVRPANINKTADAHVILTPSTGSHTYKLTAIRNSGTGTVTFGAAATLPAYILVEDIGT